MELPVGAKAASSGAAAYRREAVVVADIMTDPLCEDYGVPAAEHGNFVHAGRRRSCRNEDAVLGVFAMYSKEAAPTDRRRAAACGRVAHRIAGIAIERKLDEDRIHFMANHDALTGLPNRALLNDRLF